nr:hypothetical protein [Tanacetum cinerariifolium]
PHALKAVDQFLAPLSGIDRESMNPGLNTRFWTRKDVDRRKEFMFAIRTRLKIRRIFRNLESFVGARVRDGDYRLLKRTESSRHFGIL